MVLQFNTLAMMALVLSFKGGGTHPADWWFQVIVTQSNVSTKVIREPAVINISYLPVAVQRQCRWNLM